MAQLRTKRKKQVNTLNFAMQSDDALVEKWYKKHEVVVTQVYVVESSLDFTFLIGVYVYDKFKSC